MVNTRCQAFCKRQEAEQHTAMSPHTLPYKDLWASPFVDPSPGLGYPAWHPRALLLSLTRASQLMLHSPVYMIPWHTRQWEQCAHRTESKARLRDGQLSCMQGARDGSSSTEGNAPSLAGAYTEPSEGSRTSAARHGGTGGPGFSCLSGNSRTKLSGILVGAMGFGKSDSISLLSGEWNFVVTP